MYYSENRYSLSCSEKSVDQSERPWRDVRRTSARSISARADAVDGFRDDLFLFCGIILLMTEHEDGLFKEGGSEYFRRVAADTADSARSKVGSRRFDCTAADIAVKRKVFVFGDVIFKICVTHCGKHRGISFVSAGKTEQNFLLLRSCQLSAAQSLKRSGTFGKI